MAVPTSRGGGWEGRDYTPGIFGDFRGFTVVNLRRATPKSPPASAPLPAPPKPAVPKTPTPAATLPPPQTQTPVPTLPVGSGSTTGAPLPTPGPAPATPSAQPVTPFEDLLQKPIGNPSGEFERLMRQTPPDPDFRRMMERPVSPRGGALPTLGSILGRVGGPVVAAVGGIFWPSVLGSGELGQLERDELKRNAAKKAADKVKQRVADKLGSILSGGRGHMPEPEIEEIVVTGRRTKLPKPSPAMRQLPKWNMHNGKFVILPSVSARKRPAPQPAARTLSGFSPLLDLLPQSLMSLLPSSTPSSLASLATSTLASLASSAGGGNAAVSVAGMRCSCTMPKRQKQKKKKDDKKKCDPCSQAKAQGKAQAQTMKATGALIRDVVKALTASKSGGVSSPPGKKRTKGRF